ncbi:hypothetical protein FK220_017730 [Flavobacteriaceae bacterium TP-CH-4]|uniref:Uncharacterized protein n=1 Tax=Pelagihabitans pacificus TaxID=2696054 RepID=A0A967AXY2_9FLAO|nr:hypothetical protein [Pelagihabitans pacificus]NHF61198.1 hypothetical protein [Pelagihabitans pacificus]
MVEEEEKYSTRGLNAVRTMDYWKSSDFLGDRIKGIPAVHGYGCVAKPMGNVMGFFIQLPDEKSIYVSSDTIYTDAVDNVIKKYKPAINVVACGTAQMDIFKPLLMAMADIIRFVKNSLEKSSQITWKL